MGGHSDEAKHRGCESWFTVMICLSPFFMIGDYVALPTRAQYHRWTAMMTAFSADTASSTPMI